MMAGSDVILTREGASLSEVEAELDRVSERARGSGSSSSGLGRNWVGVLQRRGADSEAAGITRPCQLD